MAKQAKCKSGIKGWQDKLQNVYADFTEFKGWSDIYGISIRLGYKNPENLWKKNPTIQGSTNPSDLRIIK